MRQSGSRGNASCWSLLTSSTGWRPVRLRGPLRGESAGEFLMICGIQKNLRPIDREADQKFGQREIVANVYSLLDAWVNGEGAGAPIILVDNRPPDGAAAQYKLVTYSGRTDTPPYGLIDDATA